MKMRLNKYLSRCGIASRRKADGMIAEGRVQVNGRVVREMGIRIDPEEDQIRVDGREISLTSREYIMLHKPPGYLVSRGDSFGRQTILDLIPPNYHSLFPVGRLDFNSEGLLILTNDGELAHRLMHPSYKVTKEYISEIYGHPGKRDLDRIKQGVIIDGRPAVPDDVKLKKKYPETSVFRIILHEGRKREIRRMFDAAGFRVKTLRRTAFSGLTLDRLRPGQWRRLKREEVRKLMAEVGLKHTDF